MEEEVGGWICMLGMEDGGRMGSIGRVMSYEDRALVACFLSIAS